MKSLRPHSRTRTGCLTCRSRKKKCDEVRPRCAGCRRNLLDCAWPANVAWGGSKQEDGLQLHERFPGSRPAPSMHDSSGRACALTPHSVNLLEHFTRETAWFFSMTPVQNNPLLTLLMPLGYMDDLLMHGLLALSGAHLSHKSPTNTVFADATRLHYASLIRGLRKEVSRLEEDNLERKERLLRVLVITCLYEIVSGDTEAVMFKHLHAGRRLILSILNESQEKGTGSIINPEAMSFSIELYRYLVFSNTLTPHGIASHRWLPMDPFLANINQSEMELPSSLEPIFAGTRGLFQLVPLISMLASQRLAEESSGLDSPSLKLKNSRDNIYNMIKSWRIKSVYQDGDSDRKEQINRAAETLRHGLHIYLISALAGSTISDPDDMCSIQGHLRELFSYAHKLIASQYTAILLWPVTIAGSCVTNPQEQKILLREISSSKYGMRHMAIVGDVLQLLWDDPDPRAYGPYGLHLIMEKHNLSMGLA